MYYCEGKMIVELSDLDALRRTVALMYKRSFAMDVRHDTVTVALSDKYRVVQGPRIGTEVMPVHDSQISATRRQQVINQELHDVWFYNDVAICSFYVKPV